MGRATVIGDGAWGTALALALHRNGHRTRVWGPVAEWVARTAEQRENQRFLPGIPLPAELEWTADADAASADADLMILAVPSRFAETVLRQFAGRAPRAALWMSVTKGLHPERHWRMTETIERIVSARSVAALSGPSFADEVARGVPTAVVAASRDPAGATAVQQWLTQPLLRVYTSDDVIGVEIGGALKNVIAIAAGACDGLALGDNTKAALVTRGLAEMTRLGVALGAHPETFAGLSGAGDLMLTCYGRLSRNRSFGERLGRGEPAAAILAGVPYVVEGVTNCEHAAALAREHGIDMPIAEAVRDVIAGGLAPAEAVERLMRREPKPERDARRERRPPASGDGNR